MPSPTDGKGTGPERLSDASDSAPRPGNSEREESGETLPGELLGGKGGMGLVERMRAYTAWLMSSYSRNTIQLLHEASAEIERLRRQLAVAHRMLDEQRGRLDEAERRLAGDRLAGGQKLRYAATGTNFHLGGDRFVWRYIAIDQETGKHLSEILVIAGVKPPEGELLRSQPWAADHAEEGRDG